MKCLKIFVLLRIHHSMKLYLFGAVLVLYNLNETVAKEKCDIDKIRHTHSTKMKQMRSLNVKAGKKTYVATPNWSCAFCTASLCAADEKDCKNGFASKVLEWETDIFEVSFYGSQLPKRGTVNILLNEDYYVEIEIYFEKEKKKITMIFKECRNKTEEISDCIESHVFNYKNFDTDWGCLSVGIGFLKDQKMNIVAVNGTNCMGIASSYFASDNAYDSKLTGFYFNTSDTMNITIKFDYDESYGFDGVPILLPCIPGGYAFDPYHGMPITGHNCELRYNDTYGVNPEQIGITYIMEVYYHNNENMIFEKVKPAKLKDNFSSNYFDEKGMKIEKKYMIPTTMTNFDFTNKKRVQCQYVEVPTEKTTLITTATATTTTTTKTTVALSTTTTTTKTTTALSTTTTTAVTKKLENSPIKKQANIVGSSVFKTVPTTTKIPLQDYKNVRATVASVPHSTPKTKIITIAEKAQLEEPFLGGDYIQEKAVAPIKLTKDPQYVDYIMNAEQPQPLYIRKLETKGEGSSEIREKKASRTDESDSKTLSDQSSGEGRPGCLNISGVGLYILFGKILSSNLYQ